MEVELVPRTCKSHIVVRGVNVGDDWSEAEHVAYYRVFRAADSTNIGERNNKLYGKSLGSVVINTGTFPVSMLSWLLLEGAFYPAAQSERNLAVFVNRPEGFVCIFPEILPDFVVCKEHQGTVAVPRGGAASFVTGHDEVGVVSLLKDIKVLVIPPELVCNGKFGCRLGVALHPANGHIP